MHRKNLFHHKGHEGHEGILKSLLENVELPCTQTSKILSVLCVLGDQKALCSGITNENRTFDREVLF